jgi:hypothetical protein
MPDEMIGLLDKLWYELSATDKEAANNAIKAAVLAHEH